MFKIIERMDLAKDITKITVEAPQVAKKAEAGQFVVIIMDEKGERIPLTLADWDREKGLISLIFQKVGYTTKKLGRLNPGDNIKHILGPLGQPTSVKNFGTVICMGGGVGIAEVLPVSRAFKEVGNRAIGIMGIRTKDLFILENQMREIFDELFITTDDGSYGRKGLVTDVLNELIKEGQSPSGRVPTKFPDLVYAVGPVAMMAAVSKLTQDYRIKTVVSLNPIMVDATGMCGSCRLTVEGKTVFGCVDGPDFDGHQVDFPELERRLKSFTTQEELDNEKFTT